MTKSTIPGGSDLCDLPPLVDCSLLLFGSNKQHLRLSWAPVMASSSTVWKQPNISLIIEINPISVDPGTWEILPLALAVSSSLPYCGQYMEHLQDCRGSSNYKRDGIIAKWSQSSHLLNSQICMFLIIEEKTDDHLFQFKAYIASFGTVSHLTGYGLLSDSVTESVTTHSIRPPFSRHFERCVKASEFHVCGCFHSPHSL